MDYKKEIRDRWPSAKELVPWLDKRYPTWHNDKQSFVCDFIMEHTIGAPAYADMSEADSKKAEDWIMEEYLGA